MGDGGDDDRAGRPAPVPSPFPVERAHATAHGVGFGPSGGLLLVEGISGVLVPFLLLWLVNTDACQW